MPTRRRRRLSPETAKAALLAAGLELVSERSLGDALDHLRINDLARSSGLTSGAFYHYWANQDDYRRDVLETLLAGDRIEVGRSFFAPSAAGDAEAADLVETVDQAVRRAFALASADPHHRLELALWAQQPGVEALGPLLRRARRVDTAWAVALARLLVRAGRVPVGLGGLEPLAVAAVTLGDGLLMQHDLDGTALGRRADDQGRSWDDAVLVALTLLVGATGDGPPQEPPPPPPPLAEPAVENPRRQRLVELGATAALKQPVGDALGHIRADDVVRRLDLTIGAFYHYWESQDDYRDDLVDALFAADRFVDPGAIAAVGAQIAAATDLDEAIREATTWYWQTAAGHPDNRIVFGFVALDDPYISPRRAAEAAELRRAWRDVLTTLLDRFGRRVRSPLDPDLVVLGMSASIDGLIVRHGLDPAGLDPDDEGWTLWGRTCRAMIRAATTDDPDDARSLPDLARAALGPPTGPPR